LMMIHMSRLQKAAFVGSVVDIVVVATTRANRMVT